MAKVAAKVEVEVLLMADNDDKDKKETLRFEYGEICRSFHAIDDFRAKLLALLPIASGAGISALFGINAWLDSSHIHFIIAIGVFGFAVTFGIFLYEIRGMHICKTLMDLGEKMETKLELEIGQFKERPDPKYGFVGPKAAAWIIYPATLLFWGYLVISMLYSWLSSACNVGSQSISNLGLNLCLTDFASLAILSLFR